MDQQDEEKKRPISLLDEDEEDVIKGPKPGTWQYRWFKIREWIIITVTEWYERVGEKQLRKVIKDADPADEVKLYPFLNKVFAQSWLGTQDKIRLVLTILRAWPGESPSAATIKKIFEPLDPHSEEIVIDQFMKQSTLEPVIDRDNHEKRVKAFMKYVPAQVLVDYFGLPSVGMSQIVDRYPERVEDVIGFIKARGGLVEDLQIEAKRYLKTPDNNFFSKIGDNQLVREMLAEIITPRMLAEAFIKDWERVSEVVSNDVRQLDFLAKGLMQAVNRWLRQTKRWRGWRGDLRGPDYLGCLFESIVNIQSMIVASEDPRLLPKPKYLPHFINVTEALVKAERRKVLEKRLFKEYSEETWLKPVTRAFCYLEHLVIDVYKISLPPPIYDTK